MRRVVTAVAAALALALVGCGDDGGSSADPALVGLLQDEAGQSEPVATCIAERVGEDDAVDRAALEAIIRGEGTDDVATAEAYGDAALACAEEQADGPG